MRPWYLGAGVGYSSLEPNTDQSGFLVADKTDVGYNLHLGFRWSNAWALEVFGADLGEAQLNPEGEIEYDVWGAGLLFHVTPSNRHSNFDFYLKGGWARLEISADIAFEQERDGQVFIGAGLEYGLSDRWLLRGELVRYDEDATQFTLGLVVRF